MVGLYASRALSTGGWSVILFLENVQFYFSDFLLWTIFWVLFWVLFWMFFFCLAN
jgi:hypothetical protein